MSKQVEYWQSDWYRAEKGLPPLPDPDLAPPKGDPVPSDEQLAFEIAPFTPDPMAVREHQTRRLHEIGEAMAKKAMQGDIQSARAFVGISERIAKVVGLDAPKEIAMQVATFAIPRTIKEMSIAELEAALADLSIQGECTREGT